MPKLLFVGPNAVGANGTSWRNALAQLGYEIRTIDSERSVPYPTALAACIANKLRGRPPDAVVRRFNDSIIAAAREFRPDMSMYVKASWVSAGTLAETAKYGPNLAWMNDDMFNPANQTRFFAEAVRRFDCVFTTKSYNVREFQRAGAPLALYVPNSYDPEVHFPVRPAGHELPKFTGDVAFIGTFRPGRADYLARLADRREFQFNIWGGGWHKARRADFWHRRRRWRNLLRSIRGPELWAAEMGKAIHANRVVLNLLHRGNRDLQTCRSFEIPACRGLMLADRTEEHRMYFEEDKEAVYFASFEEMVDKARFYVAHDSARDRIAAAAYERSINSGYRYVDRAQRAMRTFLELAGARSRRAIA